MNLTAPILVDVASPFENRSALSNSLRLATPKQLVFIDRNITDYHALAVGLLPGIATVLVNSDSNGIDQITEALRSHRGLTAIHIVSHGTSGSVQLGNGYLELDNLADYTDSLRSWSRSLATDAEILLYGCEVAQGGRGAALVSWLGELIQVRVVAKATKTGNPALGGDWDLAASVPLAFTLETMGGYQGVLANTPTNGDDILTGTGGADTIDGLDGNDIISSGAGVDTITGGAGDDTLNPGTSDSTFTVYDNVDGGTGTDTLVLDYSGKTYYGGLVVNSQNLVTGAGDFSAQVNTGNYLGQNSAHDRVVYFNIEKFNITGTNLNDTISGGNSDDRLTGGKGNDTINGNAGNDIIIGIDSKDTNPGNAEIDTLTGGADNDIFVLSANGKDFYATSGNGDYAKITDFSITQDVIQLRGAATDYSVASTTIGGVTAPSTALYRGSELIAVLQGVTSTSVNLTSTAFSYTDYTIINDLPPIVTISNATSVAEGQSGTSVANFTVKLTSPTTKTVTVPYTITDGTATTGDSDYIGATTGSLTFLTGETTKNISVVINSDTKVEPDETFTVTLGTPTNGTLATTTTATGTILNDDTTVTIASSANGAEGNNAAQFTLTRAGVTASTLTVPYTLTGTATNVSDYNIPLSATFAADSTTAVINLNVIDDNLFEGATPETVIVNLTAGTNYTLGTSTATINIADNDSRPVISVSNVAIAEGNTSTSNAGFRVSLSNPSTETVTVNLSTQDGTATTANNDYQALTNQTVTFTPGQTSQVVNIAVSGDLNFEANETFSVVLNNATNGVISSTAGTGTGTINNDDLPTISVTVTDANAAETLTGQPANFGEFTFTRAGGETVEKTFLYTLSGTATNGSDYSMPGAVTFAAGSATAKVTLNPTDDNLFEGATPETAILTLIDDSYYDYSYYSTHQYDRAASYRVDPTNNTGTISIADNDSRPTISIADATQVEGNSLNNLGFNLTLSNPTVETVTVKYNTADGTATINGTANTDADYQAANGTATFNPLQTSQTITVAINGDKDFESDETLAVNLSDAQNTSGITRSTATGTLTNDDTLPSITVEATTPISTEGVGEGLFTFTRTGGNSDRPLNVFYELGGNATTLQSYATQSGSINFAAGSTTATLGVPVLDNNVYNFYRSNAIVIFPNIGYAIGTGGSGGGSGSGSGSGGSGGGSGSGSGGGSATVTIVDNDPIPTLSINDANILEGDGGTKDLTFTVTLSNASDDVVKVDYASVDGTAKAASDYLVTTGTLNFAPANIIAGTTEFTPGETTKTITVKINGDNDVENNETFTLKLTNAVGGTLGKATGTGTITNDDTLIVREKADILWRNEDSRVALWQMDGATVTNGTYTSIVYFDPSWKVTGIGDFNGDKKSDVLWSNSNTGEMAIWQMNGSQVVDSTLTSSPLPDASWKFSGIGDFNGDSKSDILWYNTNNDVVVWQMNGSTVVSSTLTSTPSHHSNWKVAGVLI